MGISLKQSIFMALSGTVLLLAACAPSQQQGAPAASSPAAGTVEQGSAGTSSAGSREVVTSINVLADMIRNVAGERASVASAVPAGSDVHSFQPTPRDIQLITAAELVILNGGGLEEGLERTIRNNVRQGTPVVELFERVPEGQRIEGHGHEDEHEDEEAKPAASKAEPKPKDEHAAEANAKEALDEHEEGANPHAWLDPRLAVLYVEGIRDALSELDPEGRAVYESNAQRYIAEIRAVDSELEEQLKAIPDQRRKLVTFHDAYPYLAQRYGLEVIGVVVESPEREPSAAEVAQLVTRIREQQVPAVYSEPQVNARILELAARDAGVRVLPLYSDSLDEQLKTYLELLRFNARQLVEGLG